MEEQLDVGSLGRLLCRFGEARVLVVGDLMLDDYISGETDRISPEAPVPVVRVDGSFERPGGAANVAAGLAAFGARVSIAGVVGADDSGRRLVESLTSAGLDTKAILVREDRPTTRKLRVLARGQQVLRLDWEAVLPLDQESVEELVGGFSAAHDESPFSAVIVSDYGKGVLTRELVARVVAFAGGRIPVLVDPKAADFSLYRGVDHGTPNLKELENACGRAIEGSDDLEVETAARELLDVAAMDSMVVTRGDQGMLVVERDGPATAIAASAQDVYDVTGAGDTVIAALALALASGSDLVSAARIANVAAGVVVGKVGAAVVKTSELAARMAPRIATKRISRAELQDRMAWWKLLGKKVVFTNGCFDLVHTGHLRLLEAAASLGDILIVGLNTDSSVRRLKGESRPMVREDDRATILAAFECVSGIVLFDEETPLELIVQVRPDVLVKGSDYRVEDVVGHDLVGGWGGRVELVDLLPDRSTTALIEKMSQPGE